MALPTKSPTDPHQPSQAREPEAALPESAPPSFRTLSGEPIRELYTPADLPAGVGSEKDPVGLPGEYPFTRGIHSSMYRGRLWTMRQFAGFGTSEETNARFPYLPP